MTRTEQVWAYISKRHSQGLPPASLEEIAAAVGVRAKTTAFYDLRKLERLGVVELGAPRRTRAYRVKIPLLPLVYAAGEDAVLVMVP